MRPPSNGKRGNKLKQDCKKPHKASSGNHLARKSSKKPKNGPADVQIKVFTLDKGSVSMVAPSELMRIL